MKTITLTVDIKAVVNDDVDPNEVTFRGIEAAVPMIGDKDVGHVEGYCTQEYFGEEAVEHCRTPGCNAKLDDGEGYDGLCGNCADREEP